MAEATGEADVNVYRIELGRERERTAVLARLRDRFGRAALVEGTGAVAA
ncbi:hypothetical protein [Streptomyces sp. SM12]|nr:hypothetical protein [Streptomyces sp. SM12]